MPERHDVPEFVISPAATIRPEEFFHLIDANRARLSYYFPGTCKCVVDIAAAEEFLADKRRLENGGFYFFRGLRFVPSHKLIGIVSLRYHRRNNKGGLTCYLDKAYEGRGHMYRGLQRFLSSCTESMDLRAVFAYIDPGNHRIRRIIEGLGFTKKEGPVVEFVSGRGEKVFLDYYELRFADKHSQPNRRSST